MFKKTLLGAVVVAAASLGSLAPVAANAQQYTVIRVAPPAPMQEAVPAPRRGYVWAPGFYDHRNGQYVWVTGHWVRERSGHEWREARWVERNGEWRRVGGDWQRRGPYGDRDRDGIANRYDRDNDHARGSNGPNGDRDGDGIRNRYDRFPNDPNRS